MREWNPKVLVCVRGIIMGHARILKLLKLSTSKWKGPVETHCGVSLAMDWVTMMSCQE